MEDSLHGLVLQTEGSLRQHRMLEALATRLASSSAIGLVEKLREFKGKATESVIAECAMGEALSLATGAEVHFQSGDAHDLRLRSSSLDCTVEVQLKSSASAFSEVFHPEPDVLLRYRDSAKAWQRAAWRLDEAVRGCRFAIQPWVGAALAEPFWTFAEREEQERLCGEVADWFVGELARVPVGAPAELVHPHARFELKPVDGPGWVCGEGPLEAFVVRTHEVPDRVSLPRWLRRAIEKKAERAATHPARRGANHLVGLVVDEALACMGHALSGVVLGGSHAVIGDTPADAYSYRELPVAARQLLDDARARGREALLEMMKFEVRPRLYAPPALTADPRIYEHIDGVVALYYTGRLQFLPIPFAAHDIEPVCAVLPRTIEPFDPGEWGTSGGSS